MAKVLTSISLDAPASPVSASISDTFAFTGTPTLTGGGGVQRYDFKWEVNDGGGWVTIGASGTGLITAGTNPVVNTNSQSANSITVSCDEAGSYSIRMVGAPVSGGLYTVLSSTQSVTVSAVTITGAGVIAAQSASMSGFGVSGSVGSGVLAAAAAALSGSGTVSDPVTTVQGSGVLVSGAADLAGFGISGSAGTGVLVVGAASLSGFGTVSFPVITGSGVLLADGAQIDGHDAADDDAPSGGHWISAVRSHHNRFGGAKQIYH